MSRLHTRALAAVAVLLLGLLIIWLASQMQPYEDVVEHGPAPEARSNPYLAAELFLRGLDITVEHHEGIGGVETLPSEGQTLLLLGDRRNLTPRQTERLLDWAAAGGHLVVVAERLWDEKQAKVATCCSTGSICSNTQRRNWTKSARRRSPQPPKSIRS